MHVAAGELEEARAEVAGLLSRGDITRLARNGAPREVADAAGQPVTSLSLGVSTECNLRCRHCFGREHGGRDDVLYRQGRGHMSQETALGAVAFLFDRSAGARDLTVNFFGGEPLLNDAVVEATAAACQERAAREQKRVTFAMTTNGTLLDERRLDMLWRHGIRPLNGPYHR